MSFSKGPPRFAAKGAEATPGPGSYEVSQGLDASGVAIGFSKRWGESGELEGPDFLPPTKLGDRTNKENAPPDSKKRCCVEELRRRDTVDQLQRQLRHEVSL